ncbi:MAG: tyrosine-type recombinase/integrase [Spirochaetota bacterium]|nr:tyrosine-type recombinase/integrase [Spirochaetota bacterium]
MPTGRTRKEKHPAEAFGFEAVMERLKIFDLGPDEAARIVDLLRRRGLVKSATVRDDGPGLIDWLLEVWNYEKSSYVAERKAHGQRIGRRRCQDATYAVKGHWKPYFGDMGRNDVTREDLKAFSLHLSKSELSPKSVNNILSVGTVPLHWAAENEIIRTDPTRGLRKFSGRPKQRGILTEKEVSFLFSLPWKDERSRIGNLLAASTGLRAGEVLGLRVEDIGKDRLYIRHSWSNADGLKETKTGESRVLPLAPALRAELLQLADKNPHGKGPGQFIFWSVTKSGRPMDFHFLLDHLKDMLILMKAGKDATAEEIKKAREYWKARNVVFHSWRHRFAAVLADRIDQRTAMFATGHNTGAVFESYSNHETEENLKRLTEVMGHIVPFQKEAK